MVQRRVLRLMFALCALAIAVPGSASGAGIDAGGAAAWAAFGPQPDEDFGEYVAPAGDVNGDGTGDLLVNSTGSVDTVVGAYPAARAYVLFVRPGVAPATEDLNHLDPQDGYRIFSEQDDSYIYSLADAGDVNGDGVPDQVIGLMNNAHTGVYAGRAVILFGRRSGGAVNLDELTAAEGYRFDGPASSRTGTDVRNAGDVNGDLVPDQLVLSPNTSYSHPGAGTAWVVFGRRPAPAAPIDLEALGTADGYRIDGPTDTGHLEAIDDAGDVNGDGIPDQLVGVPLAAAGVGRAYVVFGRHDGTAGPIELDALGSGGYAINGTQGLGVGVGNAGDVSGDGIPDQLIGSAPRFASDPEVGHVYVVFGQRGSTEAIDGEHPTPATGYAIDGSRPGATTGWWVRSAGDVSGDGVPDALLDDWGAATPGGADAGSAYVVFGRRGAASGSVELSALGSAAGYRIDGAIPGGELGTPIDAGDVNGDGHPDQFVGSPLITDPRGGGKGAVYLVHAPTPPAALAAPVLEGDVRAGGTAACRPAPRPFNASLTEQIAWLRDGAEIAAATARTHAIAAADLGHVLACRVTLSGALGDRSAVSAGITVPQPSGPPPPAAAPPVRAPSGRVSAAVAHSLLPADRAAARRCATGLLLVVRVTAAHSFRATIEGRVGRRLIVSAVARTRAPASRHLLCVGRLGRARLTRGPGGALPLLSVRVLRAGVRVAAVRGPLIVRRPGTAGARGTSRSSAADPRRARPWAASR